MKKLRCYNCQHAGAQFKVHKLTHVHCADPTKYNQETFDKGEFTAWDTLRVFSDTCENHKMKESENLKPCD
jgi:hypothetical protein